MAQSRELGNIGIHPSLLDRVTDDDKAVMEVHEILKQFRPTHNMIEIGYQKAGKIDKLNELREALSQQNKVLKYKQDRAELRTELRKKEEEMRSQWEKD